MKLVKEHIIFEKFTEESDPIDDLGIGMMHEIKKYVESLDDGFIIKIKNENKKNQYLWICAKYGKTKFVEYLLSIGADVHHRDNFALRWAAKNNHIEVAKLLLEAGADIYDFGEEAIEYARGYKNKTMYNLFKKYMKVGESLNEKFSNIESDPIHDMGIGPQETVYRCHECGDLLDENYDELPEGQEKETAKIILKIFGDKSDKIKYVWCNSCADEELDRQQQEQYAREQQWEYERQQEEEERYRYENDRY